jgi:hypothetical protein
MTRERFLGNFEANNNNKKRGGCMIKHPLFVFVATNTNNHTFGVIR